MLLDLPTVCISGAIKPRVIYGYAGIRPSAVVPRHVGPAERSYSPRISTWMRKKIEGLVLAGGLTNQAIGKQLDVSTGQVNYTSRRMYLRGVGQHS